MKKLIFLIPFMLVLSSCGDDINSDQTSSQATAGIGGGDITPNPDGDNSGSTGGSTTNPADPVNTGSDDTGTSTDPVNPGSDESGTSTDPVNPGSDDTSTSTDPVNPGSDDTGTSTDPVNPGSDDTGTSTDPVNPGSDDTGTSTDPVNPGSDESGSEIVDIVVVPGGGNESGSEIVDIVVVPGGGDESGSEIVDIVVVPGGNEEDKEAPKYTDTIFDYINRDNLYYRSTLSASEKAVYDRLYDSFKSFYGRNAGPVEPCTDGVLCGATDGFIEAPEESQDGIKDGKKVILSCVDEETGDFIEGEVFVQTPDGGRTNKCTYEIWYNEYKSWADSHCIYPETGEPRLNVYFEPLDRPVCGHERYNSLYAEWLYKNTVGVPVSLLDVQNGLTNSALKSIEEKLMLDLSNLYLFKAGGQVSNTKYDILNYYKIQPVSSFSSADAVKEQWVSQMKQIQEKVYRAIWDYTDGKIDKFEDLLNRYLWALIDNFVIYDENGASDITGAITGSFNAKGLARLFTFACQISSDYQCVYVEGKANYSTGFGNHGGEEFDHAWVIVKNSKLCSNNEDALIDPLRLNGLRLADTWPYRCVSSPENAGYKPNIK